MLNEPRREFQKGYKNSTLYLVNGIPLDRLDLIYHILAWARDNKQSNYPKYDFLKFIQYIVDQGYKRSKDVTILEARSVAETCEEFWFNKSRMLKKDWSEKKL